MQDVTNWVKSCRCKKTKGAYNDSNVKQGSLIDNLPLNLLCLNFTKLVHSKDGKEIILIMMDVFSNFTVAGKNSGQSPGRQMVLHLWNTI